MQRLLRTACRRFALLLIIPLVGDVHGHLRNSDRLDQAELKEANLHEGIDDSLMLIHHDTKNRVEVERDYGDIPS